MACLDVMTLPMLEEPGRPSRTRPKVHDVPVISRLPFILDAVDAGHDSKNVIGARLDFKARSVGEIVITAPTTTRPEGSSMLPSTAWSTVSKDRRGSASTMTKSTGTGTFLSVPGQTAHRPNAVCAAEASSLQMFAKSSSDNSS